MSEPTTFGASNPTSVPKSPYSGRLGYSPRRTIFQSQDCLSFAHELELSVTQNIEEYCDVLVRRALPVIPDRLPVFE
jgi:hypothetical protein